MELIESTETSAYNNTLTPGTYPKEKKLQSKHGESLKLTILLYFLLKTQRGITYKNSFLERNNLLKQWLELRRGK